MEQKLYDVLILGGSYAGLQAAMTLGRCLREVLIVDSGESCNRFAPEAHNIIAHDGDGPDEIRDMACRQALSYPTVTLEKGFITSVRNDEGRFIAEDGNGNIYTAKKLVLATGLKDILPDIKGFSDCWGKSVVHCPYCHGYELRDKEIGLLAGASAATRFVPLVRNWSKRLRFFVNDNNILEEETRKYLEERNIPITGDRIAEIVHTDGHMNTIVMEDGSTHKLDALFVSLPCVQQSDIAMQLGCSIDDGGFIEVEVVGKTNVPGVYAAGDCTTPMRAIPAAIAAGYKAAIGINNEFIEEENLEIFL